MQVFFLYFGLTKLGITLSGFTCGVIGLSFLGGAYMAESFRAGVDAQVESGQALGLSKIQLLRYIVMPISFLILIPSIAANCIFLVKETSIIASIAVGELMFLTKGLIGMYYKTKESLILVVIFYLIILLPMSIASRKIEGRLRYGEFGH